MKEFKDNHLSRWGGDIKEFRNEHWKNRFLQLLFKKECENKDACDNSELCIICKEGMI